MERIIGATWLAIAVALAAQGAAAPPALGDPPAAVAVVEAPASLGGRISLRWDGILLSDVLDFALEGSDLEVRLPDSVDVPLYAALDSVPAGEVVAEALDRAGLEWTVEDGAIVASTLGTRSFLVPRLGAGAGGDGDQTSAQTFWEELGQNVSALLSPDGRVVVSKQTGRVTVVDRPEALARVTPWMETLHGDLARQVNLEAQILETELSQDVRAGVDWQVRAYGWDGVRGGTDAGNLIDQFTVDEAGVFQLGLIRTDRMSVLLDLLERRGKVRVLSRPRVASLGNQPAVFKATENVPYYEQEIFTTDGAQPYTQYSVSFREAGVTLEVQAQVAPDGSILLQVHPTVSEVTGFTEALPNLPPQPIIDARETETTVRVRDGQTLVIGGLVQSRQTTSVRGVPVLSKLPWVGALFRSEEERTVERELTVLLTPSLLGDTAVERLGTAAELVPIVHAWTMERGERLSLRQSLAIAEHARALRAFRASRLDEAAARAERAAELWPEANELRLNLGLFLASVGRLREARAEWTRLLVHPEWREVAHANLGALDLVEDRAPGETTARAVESAVEEAQVVLALNETSRLLGLGARDAARAILAQATSSLGRADSRRLLEARLHALDASR